MMGQDLLFPMLIAKLMRKNVVLALAVSSVRSSEAQNDIFSKPLFFLSKINCTLSEKIIVYSKNLIKEWDLEKYRNKIYIAHEHFLDFDKFKMKKKFGERDNLVGYIGRLSEEKGTLNFVKAIPEISKEKDIGGDGQLREEIEKYFDDETLYDKVNLAGWIPHDKLPDYLNELKLIVLPSYTEGLPNVMLEAMACGTPVIVTDRCGIADFVDKVGYVVEYDKDQLRNAIFKILSDEGLRKRFGEEGRRFVKGVFGWDRIERKVEKIYKDIIVGVF
jgi:glycosyltransferase involved in cell wall biosynthesis